MSLLAELISTNDVLARMEERKHGYERTIGEFCQLWPGFGTPKDPIQYEQHEQAIRLALSTFRKLWAELKNADEERHMEAMATSRKVVRQLLASSFGRQIAIYSFPSIPTEASHIRREVFLNLAVRSRACRRMIFEPTLNLLPRFINAIALSLSAAVKVAESGVSLHEEERVRLGMLGDVKDCLDTLIRIVTPEMGLEGATFYASVVKSNDNLYNALGETLRATRLGAVPASDTHSLLHIYSTVELQLQIKFHVQLPFSQFLLMSIFSRGERLPRSANSKFWKSLSDKEAESGCAADGCETLNPKMLCERCRVLKYCSTECQNAHRELHKKQCEKLQKNLTYVKAYWNTFKDTLVESVCATVGCMNLAPQRKCTRCHMAQYCDETCQKTHWKLHRAVCREDFWNVEGIFPADMLALFHSSTRSGPSSPRFYTQSITTF
ncbi:hypothetical protein M427DRAFT_54620 [Gonapodya prolifera JEL478]|uniref:phytol kinase n=1 Tax=Gonapodya prolifera (strain JEL478) TaxID=1344416 RepID=A0A139AKN4_GONPJ|nr:hypothetical protein M427DRAFT_54620 [Gonapodya prolifera JEL478]|eukprot:KXS17330.1 hypothetical protein M427DRAFT_54620 [Gonapodya prolifera JEL478]